jgi:glycosyltransferase involved in cell wall biosynthesis
MKVAYYSPLPPERSGIADYSALLLPALRERLELVLPSRTGRRAPRGTDVALYHVGNDPQAHGWIVDALRRRRGVVVLHDFVLHHLVAGMTLGRGDAEGYRVAMYRDAGVVGRLLAHGVVDRLVPAPWETRPEDFPLVREVLQFADGLIVHSRYVEEHVRETGYSGPIWRIPHPAWTPPAQLPPPRVAGGDAPVIGCFGNLTPAKRIPQLLAAFAQLRRRFPDAVLVLAGAATPGAGITGADGVVHLDYVEEPELWSQLAACDVCVSLRWPTMGETSGIAIRALSIGKPLVVSDVGSFAELPDAVAAKVPVDEREIDALTSVLERLVGDRELRERMGAGALEHVRRHHDVGRVAEAYTAALEEFLGGDAVRADVLAQVAAAAADVGLTSDSPELADAAAAVRETGLGD